LSIRLAQSKTKRQAVCELSVTPVSPVSPGAVRRVLTWFGSLCWSCDSTLVCCILLVRSGRWAGGARARIRRTSTTLHGAPRTAAQRPTCVNSSTQQRRSACALGQVGDAGAPPSGTRAAAPHAHTSREITARGHSQASLEPIPRRHHARAHTRAGGRRACAPIRRPRSRTTRRRLERSRPAANSGAASELSSIQKIHQRSNQDRR
jgi:hypothetical protein